MSRQLVCPCNPSKSFASARNLRRHGYQCSIYMAKKLYLDTPRYKNKDISCMCGWKPTPKLKNVSSCKWRMKLDLAEHAAKAGCKDAPPMETKTGAGIVPDYCPPARTDQPARKRTRTDSKTGMGSEIQRPPAETKTGTAIAPDCCPPAVGLTCGTCPTSRQEF